MFRIMQKEIKVWICIIIKTWYAQNWKLTKLVVIFYFFFFSFLGYIPIICLANKRFESSWNMDCNFLQIKDHWKSRVLFCTKLEVKTICWNWLKMLGCNFSNINALLIFTKSSNRERNPKVVNYFHKKLQLRYLPGCEYALVYKQSLIVLHED